MRMRRFAIVAPVMLAACTTTSIHDDVARV